MEQEQSKVRKTRIRTSRFDHAAIAADLEDGMPVKEVVEKHSCSVSLVQRIRRDNKEAGTIIPRNIRRAEAIRKKVAQLMVDQRLLRRWTASKDPNVKCALDLINDACNKLESVAALYEVIPEESMVSAKPSTDRFAPGTVVRIKPEVRETYLSVTTSPDHLVVLGRREGDNRRVIVQDEHGAHLFLFTKELEPQFEAAVG